MCFVKSARDYGHKVAETDLICYKVLLRMKVDGGYRSVYANHPYEIGELYHTHSTSLHIMRMDSAYALYDGVYHSYHDIEALGAEYHNVLHQLERVSWGIHYDAVNVKCIIPKGAIYWKNEEEYASVSIKIVGVIDV